MPEGVMMAAATLFFGKDRPYRYIFDMPENPTKANLAMAISQAIARKERCRKYTGHPPKYNLIVECLNKNGRINFSEIEKNKISDGQKKMIFQDCQERNNEEKGIFQKDEGYYERLVWRVGYTFSNVQVLDIDGLQPENLQTVRQYYEKLLGVKFEVVQTKNGYWLFSNRKYENLEDWQYDHCRILNPYLKNQDFSKYLEKLKNLDYDEKGNFRKASIEDMKKHGLLTFPTSLNFDVLFTYLSIVRGRSTLRITKKSKNDKIELLK